MTLYRLAVAGRYQDRAAIKEALQQAGLDREPFELTASWLDATAEQDADLTDEQAQAHVETNLSEIAKADVLLYVPCYNAIGMPFWSPGRLIDFGVALGFGVPVIVVGNPEPTIYQRRSVVTVCERLEDLAETVKKFAYRP